jgi:hypothetical protein
MIKTVYLIVEEGADRVYVWTTFPSSYVAPKDRRSQILVVDISLDGFEIAAGKIAPVVRGELVECPTCKRPEGAVNHVPGHIFVGWGQGWQPCPKCAGSMRTLMPADAAMPVVEEQDILEAATPTEVASATCRHPFDDRQQMARGLIWCSRCGAMRQRQIGWLLPLRATMPLQEQP